MSDAGQDPRRAIPAIDALLAAPAFRGLLGQISRELLVAATRAVQVRLRRELSLGVPAPAGIADPEWYLEQVETELAEWRRASLVPVINATGVVLHTNLGRAPLAPAALAAVLEAGAGYCNLEYDLERGERGSRYDHCVTLLRRLTGAEDGLVVNNNAAALVLAVNTLSHGREAIISRGELVEIGGEFRIPDMVSRSGAIMIEVGATNRTHLHDYRAAITPRTALLLKVHRSNFQLSGFVAEVGTPELAQLAQEHGLPLLHDLGSGLLAPDPNLPLPTHQTVADALLAGADLVTVSGDKLLGGPQAGILCGRAEHLAACRANPLCRAFRVDKLTLAALSATLALHTDPVAARAAIPALGMLAVPLATLEHRAGRLATALSELGVPADTGSGESRVGGGALPDARLPTCVVRLRPPGGPARLERALRAGAPPVVSRVQNDELLLDPRTVPESSEDTLVRAVVAAWSK